MNKISFNKKLIKNDINTYYSGQSKLSKLRLIDLANTLTTKFLFL